MFTCCCCQTWDLSPQTEDCAPSISSKLEELSFFKDYTKIQLNFLSSAQSSKDALSTNSASASCVSAAICLSCFVLCLSSFFAPWRICSEFPVRFIRSDKLSHSSRKYPISLSNQRRHWGYIKPDRSHTNIQRVVVLTPEGETTWSLFASYGS